MGDLLGYFIVLIVFGIIVLAALFGILYLIF